MFEPLGQQTVNSEEDARFIRRDTDINEQIQDRDGLFDCPNRATARLPSDILETRPPLPYEEFASQARSWEDVGLYTNLCLDRVPVLIHHNGWKEAREASWPKLWIQPHARTFMRSALAEDEPLARTADGRTLFWSDICPENAERELFRDVS